MSLNSTVPVFSSGLNANNSVLQSAQKSQLDQRQQSERVLTQSNTPVNEEPKPSLPSDNETNNKNRNWKFFGNIAFNGGAAGLKLLSATGKFLGLNMPDFVSSGELVTRSAMIGQCAIGLYDAVEKKNSPVSVGQALEVALICAAEDKDKWLLRGVSQGLINIGTPIIQAYEILQKALGNNITSYNSDYSNLPLSQAIKESFIIPIKTYGNNLSEIIKKPSLIKENLTYALSVASTFMYSGGLLGLTPFKGIASVVRFMGAIPADIIYAFMGHHTEKGYDPKNKFDMKKMFDFKSYLGWAGKLWLVPGILDPIKRLPQLENIMEPLTDICDAFDRCASGLYQQHLLGKDKKEKSELATAQ